MSKQKQNNNDDNTTEVIDMDEVTCDYCGTKITNAEANILFQGESGNCICTRCIKLYYNKIMELEEEQKKNALNKMRIKATPSYTKRYLDSYIIGQEEAKKVLSVAVYNHYKSLKIKKKDPSAELEKSNIILLGPTGCGKTAILKALSKLLRVPFTMADATTLTSAGFVGNDVENVLQRLVAAAGGDVKKAEKGIVYIDEIDKLSRKSDNPSISIDPSHEGVQQSLLKMVEGSVVDIPLKPGEKLSASNHGSAISIDTSNILFIVGGAFEGIEKIISKRLTENTSSIGFNSSLKDKTDKSYNDYTDDVTVEDLKKFGILPELLGRFPIICTMQELDEDALVHILTEPKNSLVKQFKTILAEDDVDLEFTDSALKAIANEAIERKTGARSLRSILEKTLNHTMYSLPDDKNINRVVVDTDDQNKLVIKTDKDNTFRKHEGEKVYAN